MPGPMVAMAIMGMAMSAGGGIMGAKGASKQASYYDLAAQQTQNQKRYLSMQQQEEARKYREQAKLAEMNLGQLKHDLAMNQLSSEFATINAQRQAGFIERNGQEAITRIWQQASQVEGMQVSGFLKAGVTMEGTPALLVADTAKRAADDVANAREAMRLQSQEALDRGFFRSLAHNEEAAKAMGATAQQYMFAGNAYRSASFSQNMLPLQMRNLDYQAAMYGAQAGAARMSGMAGMVGGLTSGFMAGASAAG